MSTHAIPLASVPSWIGQLAERGDQHRLRERERERGHAEDEQAPHRVRTGVRVCDMRLPGERETDWGVRNRSANRTERSGSGSNPAADGTVPLQVAGSVAAVSGASRYAAILRTRTSRRCSSRRCSRGCRSACSRSRSSSTWRRSADRSRSPGSSTARSASAPRSARRCRAARSTGSASARVMLPLALVDAAATAALIGLTESGAPTVALIGVRARRRPRDPEHRRGAAHALAGAAAPPATSCCRPRSRSTRSRSRCCSRSGR